MPWAILSGILAALSLPVMVGDFSSSLAELAWFCLIPVYLVFRQSSVKRSFYLGCATGLSLYLASQFWIFIALRVYGEVPIWGSLLGLLLLATTLSLYLGGAFALAAWLQRRSVFPALAFPICWVLQDWVRNFFPFGGLSWSSLAYTQGHFASLIQVVDLTGPYGVTFLILLSNVLFGEVFLFYRKKSPVPSRLAFVFISMFLMTLLYGFLRQTDIQRQFESLPQKKLLLIQGNVPQEIKWDQQRS